MHYLILSLLLLLNFAPTAAAQETLRLGIFAYRPKPVMAEQYRPLATYLEQKLPNHQVEMHVLTQTEMEQALRDEKLDLLFTNPSHFTLLRSTNHLSGAIATQVTLEKGIPVNALGGVIFTSVDRVDINRLEDIRGKRLAVPGTKFLGGYQTQAYELLEHNIRLPQDVSALHTLNGHDSVVMHVLAGKADVGFVRTGIIESMAREGKLDPAHLRVINQQDFPYFPFVASTRLYPEWAFAALPHVDEKLVRQIARALLEIEYDSPVAQAAGIYGFTVPADYLPVENLARALRLPPFDKAPEFTLADAWSRWALQLAMLLGVAVILVLLMMRLTYTNRLLLRQRILERLHLAALGEGVCGMDAKGYCTFINPAALSMLGYEEVDVIGRNLHDVLHSHHADHATHPCPFLEAFQHGSSEHIEENFTRKDGSHFPVSGVLTPMELDGELIGKVLAFQDISERKILEAELNALATTDSMTGLPNRRQFFKQAADELARVRRTPEQPASLIMIDIDHFKKINDIHGHGAGDAVLRQFAQILLRDLRKTDVAGRIGGEEFTLLLPATRLEDALLRAERLRSAIEAESVSYADTQIVFSISAGVTELQATDEQPEAALLRADRALYEAKESGRNRVVAA